MRLTDIFLWLKWYGSWPLNLRKSTLLCLILLDCLVQLPSSSYPVSLFVSCFVHCLSIADRKTKRICKSLFHCKDNKIWIWSLKVGFTNFWSRLKWWTSHFIVFKNLDFCKNLKKKTFKIRMIKILFAKNLSNMVSILTFFVMNTGPTTVNWYFFKILFLFQYE